MKAPRQAGRAPAPPIDPALRRFVEALAKADARQDYRAAREREGADDRR